MKTPIAYVIAGLLTGTALAQTVPGSDAVSFVNEGIVEAPPSEVWKVWTTLDGLEILGIGRAEVDLRIGGLIRSRYGTDGELGDEETIHNRILAYEPVRMLAMAIDRPPASFPFKEAWKHTWTVLTLTDLGDGRTHLRIASMGFGDDEESLAMRAFFERGNQYEIGLVQEHFANK